MVSRTAVPTAAVDRSVAVGPFRVREISYDPLYRQPPHEHDRPSVTVILRGAIRETARRRDAVGAPLSIVVKPAGVEHADLVGPQGVQTLQISFEDAFARELDEHGVPLGPWRWLQAPRASMDFISLLALFRLTAPPATAALEGAVLDALASVSVTGTGTARQPPMWLNRVQARLDDDESEAVTVTTLAEEAGVHPGYLARAFQRHLGTSVTAYRRRVRLQRAAQAIAASAQPLSRVAHDAGYADHPHLCREFARTTGVTPSTFRQLVRGT